MRSIVHPARARAHLLVMSTLIWILLSTLIGAVLSVAAAQHLSVYESSCTAHDPSAESGNVLQLHYRYADAGIRR